MQDNQDKNGKNAQQGSSTTAGGDKSPQQSQSGQQNQSGGQGGRAAPSASSSSSQQGAAAGGQDQHGSNIKPGQQNQSGRSGQAGADSSSTKQPSQHGSDPKNRCRASGRRRPAGPAQRPAPVAEPRSATFFMVTANPVHRWSRRRHGRADGDPGRFRRASDCCQEASAPSRRPGGNAGQRSPGMAVAQRRCHPCSVRSQRFDGTTFRCRACEPGPTR